MTTEARDLLHQSIDRVCHEVRRPLSVVYSFAELLACGVAGELAEPQRDYVQTILRAAGQMDKLVRNLFDAAELDRGEIVLHPEPVDIAALVDTVHENYRKRYEEAGLGLFIECDGEDLEVLGESGRLVRALEALLDNGLRFIPPGADLTLSARACGERVVIEASDSGPGVPADALERIFEPFVRVPQPFADGDGGLGLGLALCRAYVLAHGGEVHAHPSAAGGLSITLELPTLSPTTTSLHAQRDDEGGPAS